MVAGLSITQTVGYGVLYYTFAVLLDPVARTLHASTTTVTGAFTASVLAGAVLAVPVGRWLDRHGARALMSLGSVAGTALLVAWARVDTLVELYLVQVGIGAVGAMVLYEPAFAVVVRWFPPERRPAALLGVTVVAGFASSIFLPVAGLLVERYGWRGALLLLAVVHGVLTVPTHLVVLRRRPPGYPPPGPAGGTAVPVAGQASGGTVTEAAGPPPRAVLADRGFWLLTLGFTANAAAMAAFTVHVVAGLRGLGHSAAFAAGVAGLLGVLSVTGRLAVTGLQRLRMSTAAVVAATFALQALAALSLPFAGRTGAGAVLAVTGFGLGFGVATIARPHLLAARYGTVRYATIAGMLAAPATLAKAVAPLLAAYAHDLSGTYTPVFVGTGITCLVAALAIAAVPGTPSGTGVPRRRLADPNHEPLREAAAAAET